MHTLPVPFRLSLIYFYLTLPLQKDDIYILDSEDDLGTFTVADFNVQYQEEIK